MKYIVMKVESKTSDLLLEVPFVFPELVVHLFMSKVCKALLENQFKDAKVTVVSAGFVSSTGFMDECYGESESIGLKSRGAVDSLLIKMCDYGGMYA